MIAVKASLLVDVLSSVEQLVYFVTEEEGGGGLSQPLSTHSFSALAS